MCCRFASDSNLTPKSHTKAFISGETWIPIPPVRSSDGSEVDNLTNNHTADSRVCQSLKSVSLSYPQCYKHLCVHVSKKREILVSVSVYILSKIQPVVTMMIAVESEFVSFLLKYYCCFVSFQRGRGLSLSDIQVVHVTSVTRFLLFLFLLDQISHHMLAASSWRWPWPD